MDNPTQYKQVTDGNLLTVSVDGDEPEAGATIENAVFDAFDAVGEDSEVGPEDEEDEDDEEDENEDSDDEGADDEEGETDSDSNDADGDDLLAENETVPSSETDFSGETPL
jgi:hypothetical protein